MTLIPNGKLCYCGKKGCTESYCSARSLVEGFDEDFQTFFQLLRSTLMNSITKDGLNIYLIYHKPFIITNINEH